MTPTRSRRLNEILGLLVLASGLMLLLALFSYAPADPSLNTVGQAGRPVHNWTGKLGASISDLLLQVLGAASLILPVVLGRLGISWMRSRALGSPAVKVVGLLLWFAAVPAALGLLPGHLVWKHTLPIEGLTGRITADALVAVINFPGACIAVGLATLISLYLQSTFTFNTAQDWMTRHFSFAARLSERWNLRRGRRDRADEHLLETRREREIARQRAAEARVQAKSGEQPAATHSLIGGLFAKWGFWRKGIRPDDVELEPEPLRINSMWARMPRTDVDAGPEPEFAPVPAHLRAEADAHLQQELAEASQ